MAKQIKRIEEIGIFCGDAWNICGQMATSLLYICFCRESCRVFKGKHPYFPIEKELMKELWRVIEDSFKKTRNIIYERFAFSHPNNKEANRLRAFYGRIAKQEEKCGILTRKQHQYATNLY